MCLKSNLVVKIIGSKSSFTPTCTRASLFSIPHSWTNVIGAYTTITVFGLAVCTHSCLAREPFNLVVASISTDAISVATIMWK